MHKLKEQIAKVLKLLTTAQGRLDRAGRRWLKNHDKAHREHKKQKEAEHAYLRAQKEGHPKLSQAEAARAKRCSHRAWKAKRRADHYVAKVKEFAAEVHNLTESLEVKRGKLKKLEDRGAEWDGHNKVNGPDKKANLELAMRLSMEHGSQFYSQVGALDLDHGITGPSRGHRHDCSSWDWSMLKAAGIPDPTGNNYDENVWTGNEAEHGEAISESQLDTGCDIFYGTAPFHHVEKKIGPISESTRTVGHGSDPIDYGVVGLLPGPRAYRRYIK